MLTYRLFLIRHGLTQGNLERRYIGRRSDLPLCEEGRKGLLALKEEFEYPDVKKVYAAPMKRCFETAEILYPDRLTVPAEGSRSTISASSRAGLPRSWPGPRCSCAGTRAG